MEERTSNGPDDPRKAAARQGEPLDPLVGEIQRDRRERRVLIVAAAVGIITGAAVGMSFLLGAIKGAAMDRRGFSLSHGAPFFVIGPPILSMAIGYAIFAWRRRRRERRAR